jgi:hypothetical protein
MKSALTFPLPNRSSRQEVPLPLLPFDIDKTEPAVSGIATHLILSGCSRSCFSKTVIDNENLDHTKRKSSA